MPKLFLDRVSRSLTELRVAVDGLQENGLRCWQKLHSSDGVIGRIDRSCYSADRHLRAQFRVDICPYSSRHGRWSSSSHDNGVALPVRRFDAWRCGAPVDSTVNLETPRNPASLDRRVWASADYLRQSLLSQIHI